MRTIIAFLVSRRIIFIFLICFFGNAQTMQLCKENDFYIYFTACKLIEKKLHELHDTFRWKHKIEFNFFPESDKNENKDFNAGQTDIEQGLLLKELTLITPLGTWFLACDYRSYGGFETFYNQFKETFTTKIYEHRSNPASELKPVYKVLEIDGILIPEARPRQLNSKIKPDQALAIWHNLKKRYKMEETTP